jgi:glycosyltransferase involved in cell wall biosynthesis
VNFSPWSSFWNKEDNLKTITEFPRVRVALVASSLGRAGAEIQGVYNARALLDAGVDLQFFYLGAGGYYENALREMEVPLRQIYFPNQPWKILLKLTAAFRRWRPHIVLAHQFGDVRFGGIAGRFCNALILGFVQSDGWYELRTYGRLSRLMVRMAHGLVTNSHGARHTLVSQGIKPQRTKVLTNVIDLQDFDARSAQPLRIPLPSGRVIVAAVGRLLPCKRFDRFLEALALARRSEPAVAGVIAGADLGEKTALQERAHRLGLGPQDLVFLGECDYVPALLARSALLVLSSDYEGLPNVIVEAMAARLPVITTPAGDAGVVVRHDKTGYVTGRNDVQGLATFMVRLARSPALRRQLGEAARKCVEQDYDYESLPHRLIGIFQHFARQQRRHRLLESLEQHISAKKSGRLSEPMVLESSAA